MAKKDINIDINVSYKQAFESIKQFKEVVKELGASNEKLTQQNKNLGDSITQAEKAYKSGLISYQTYNDGMIANRDAIINNNAEIRNNTTLIELNEKAVRILRGEVGSSVKMQNNQKEAIANINGMIKNLTEEYERLGETEAKDIARKSQISEQLENLKKQLDEVSEAQKRYQALIGDYEQDIMKALACNNQFAQSLIEMGASAGSFKGLFDMLKGKVNAFGRALFNLLKNPVVLTIAVIVLALAALYKAFTQNEERVKKFQEILNRLTRATDMLMSVFEPLGELVMNVLTVAFEALISVVERLADAFGFGPKAAEAAKAAEEAAKAGAEAAKLAVVKTAEAAAEAVKATEGVTKGAAKAAEEAAKIAKSAETRTMLLASAEDKLNKAKQEAKRINTANSAELERINALLQNESLSIKEKIELTEEAAKRSKEMLEEEKKVAEDAIYYAELRLQIEGKTAENIQAQTEAYAQLTSVNARLDKAEKDKQNKIDGYRKSGADAAKEARSKELQAVRAFEDSMLAIVEEGVEKQRKQVELSYSRQIEDLNKRLKEEKGLTEAARKAINDTIINLEKQKNNDLAKLDKDEIKRKLDEEASVQKQNIENRLAVLKAESAEALKLRIEKLELEKKLELDAAEQTGVDKAAIIAKYDKQIADQQIQSTKEANQKLVAEQKAIFEKQLLDAQGKETLVLQLKLQAKQAEIEKLKQLEGESDAEFALRKAKLQFESDELKKQHDEKVKADKKASNEAELAAYTAMYDSMEEVMEAFGASSEALAIFGKAQAGFQIAMDTAKAIAAGVAQSQSVPFPGNIPAIATTIAAVMSNVAKAKKLLSSEKSPKAPKMATGGLVTGAGSGTSDSIQTYLSNGESVLTARATQMFSPILSAFNQIGGGVPIATQTTSAHVMGEEMLSNAFSKAVRSMPNPVVSVQEIDNVTNRVEVLETSRRL